MSQDEAVYCLEAAIAGDDVLRRLAGEIVPLHGSLSMLLMTDEYFDARFQETLAACSELGPLRVAEGEPLPPEGSPISQALRALGVRRGSHFDEFDAVGLGRHRRTEEWLARPNE